MNFSIFKKYDKYTINSKLSFDEVVDVFYKKFKIDEKVYDSFWGISAYPYYGIFSKPNKFILKKSSKIPYSD